MRTIRQFLPLILPRQPTVGSGQLTRFSRAKQACHRLGRQPKRDIVLGACLRIRHKPVRVVRWLFRSALAATPLITWAIS